MVETALNREHQQEVAAGQRFEFGQNWRRFLEQLDDQRIQVAEDSLKTLLRTSDLSGKRFLDVGSGSGLFSLAARRLGATVHSLDYDPQSVACTNELRRRFFAGDTNWRVDQGSALDPDYLRSLGTFDVVYSWGVLHHTGSMWAALDSMVPLVRDGGKLAIAIYNDQGTASRRWTAVQRLYNRCPASLRFLVLWPSMVFLWTRPSLKDFLALKPFRTWRDYHKNRGMSAWHDLVDWVGGYPREVAKPEELFDFYRERGFDLLYLRTQGGSMGCNELTFIKRPTGNKA
jgi:2-polyprenyl-6-hydroxyphenyl methylase/3-demethylubiquinone-9 3-methyltransferase